MIKTTHQKHKTQLDITANSGIKEVCDLDTTSPPGSANLANTPIPDRVGMAVERDQKYWNRKIRLNN